MTSLFLPVIFFLVFILTKHKTVYIWLFITGYLNIKDKHLSISKNNHVTTFCDLDQNQSKEIDLFRKSSVLASLTFVRLLVRLYSQTTNLSSTDMYSAVTSLGAALRTWRTGVSSGNTYLTSHAVFFSRRAKMIPCRTQSGRETSVMSTLYRNLKTWQWCVRGCCGHFHFHMWYRAPLTEGRWQQRLQAQPHLSRYLTRQCPREDASRAWIIRRLSASSWVQGAGVFTSVLLADNRTPSPWVEYISFFPGADRENTLNKMRRYLLTGNG